MQTNLINLLQNNIIVKKTDPSIPIKIEDAILRDKIEPNEQRILEMRLRMPAEKGEYDCEFMFAFKKSGDEIGSRFKLSFVAYE